MVGCGGGGEEVRDEIVVEGGGEQKVLGVTNGGQRERYIRERRFWMACRGHPEGPGCIERHPERTRGFTNAILDGLRGASERSRVQKIPQSAPKPV